VLISDCGASLLAWGTNVTLAGEQVTADGATFWDTNGAPNRVSLKIALTNSIIVGEFGNGPVLATNHVAINPPGTVFQTVNTGHH
jgi:hypothetical protein